MLEGGYSIHFVKASPLSSVAILFEAYQLDSERFLALNTEAMSLVKKSAIKQVSSLNIGFNSSMFLVAKALGGWCLMIDLSFLNIVIKTTKFRMETTASVVRLMKENDWMVSMDLKFAYFHIPMHQKSKEDLCFVWKGVVWQFRSPYFGLLTTSQVFSRVVAPVAAILHTDIWTTG